jgi:predicted phage tail protein
MKTIVSILALFVSLTFFSQTKAFEITNIKSGKITIFDGNTRVKIRTLDKKKHVGLLTFSDNETLIIDNQSIKTDSILSIKKQPRVLGTVKTIVLITGLTVIGSSVIVAASGGEAAFLLFTIGTGATLSSGIIESLNPNHSNRKWTYKIIEKQ